VDEILNRISQSESEHRFNVGHAVESFERKGENFRRVGAADEWIFNIRASAKLSGDESHPLADGRHILNLLEYFGSDVEIAFELA